MPKSALVRALASFEKGKEEEALEALLVAWRDSRSPRIAELIDRIAPADGPVKGKTVKARTEAWLALAAKKPSPRVVGQLLATPWPGAWADAIPVLEAIRKLPHDPRIAMMLAKTIEATPWDTYTSAKFYRPLLAHLGALKDPRTLATLEADLARKKSGYWTRGTKPSVAKAAETIAKAPAKKLAAEDEKALAAFDKRFEGTVAKEKTKAKSEDEHLAAIYAAPDDDALRAVYADWLQEQNDPRGEMIARHLAGDAKLVKKHATAGPLERFVQKKGRVYERGFLARAALLLEGGKVPRGLDHPAWRTVHTLTSGWDDRPAMLKILALPSFRHFRRLVGVWSDVIAALPAQPALEEIDFKIDHTKNVETKIAKSKSFPALRRIGIDGEFDHVQKVLEGPLARQVEQITLYGFRMMLGPLIRFVDEQGLSNVSEVRVVHDLVAEEDTWRFSMRRDDKGRFTVLHGVLHLSERGMGSKFDIERVLRSLEPNELTSFSVDRSEPPTLDAGDIRAIEKELARFPKLAKVDVPWERLTATKKAGNEDMVVAVADFHRAERFDAAKYAKLWREVAAPPLSLTFDSYDVNGGAHQALGSDGLATLQGALAKKRTWGLAAYAKARPDRFALSHSSVTIHGLVARDASSITRYLDWLGKIVDAYAFRGYVAFAQPSSDDASDWTYLAAFDRIQANWALILDPKLDKVMPFAELAKLPKRRGLEWLRAIRTKRTLMLVLGATPADRPTPAQLTALDVAAFDVFWNTYEKKHGFRPQDAVAKALAPSMKKLGFTRVAFPDPIDEARGLVAFESSGPKKKERRWILFEVDIAPDDTVLSFHARQSRTNPKADLTMHAQVERSRSFGSDDDRIRTKAALDKAIQAAVAELPSVVAWFDEVPKASSRSGR